MLTTLVQRVNILAQGQQLELNALEALNDVLDRKYQKKSFGEAVRVFVPVATLSPTVPPLTPALYHRRQPSMDPVYRTFHRL